MTVRNIEGRPPRFLRCQPTAEGLHCPSTTRRHPCDRNALIKRRGRVSYCLARVPARWPFHGNCAKRPFCAPPGTRARVAEGLDNFFPEQVVAEQRINVGSRPSAVRMPALPIGDTAMLLTVLLTKDYPNGLFVDKQLKDSPRRHASLD